MLVRQKPLDAWLHAIKASTLDWCRYGINRQAAPLIDSDFVEKGDAVTHGDALSDLSLYARARVTGELEIPSPRVTLSCNPTNQNPRGDGRRVQLDRSDCGQPRRP